MSTPSTHFSALIQHALRTARAGRIVVCIDDLDRCLPDRILALLEALKLYLNRPECVVFLAVDAARLAASVAGKYRELGVSESDYLDKIVQAPFRLPALSPTVVRGFIAPLLTADTMPALDVLEAGLPRNPRAIIRFINTLSLHDLLARSAGMAPYEVALLAAVLLVQSELGAFYAELLEDPSRLRRVADDLEVQLEEGAQAPEPTWDPRVVRIVDALRRTSCEIPEDASAYVYLAAETTAGPTIPGRGGRLDTAILKRLLARREPGTRLDFGSADLSGSDLSGMDLSDIDLPRASLRSASLHHANLRNANLHEAGLAEANLRQATLEAAILTRARLRDSDLSGASLARADLREADLSRTRLQDADLRGADLTGVLAVDTSFQTAIWDETTRLPASRPTSEVQDADILRLARDSTIARLQRMLESSLQAVGEDRVDVPAEVRYDLGPAGWQPTTPVEPERISSSEIIAAFDQAGGQLVILGPPGGGKTTLAMQLTVALLERAKHDPTHPVPVVFWLASWTGRHDFLSWAAAQLTDTYNMPQHRATRLLGQEQFTFVLDGLDELPPPTRAGFLDALTEFRKTHGSVRFVLTSRSGEYEPNAHQLRQVSMVELQPLDERQVLELVAKRLGAEAAQKVASSKILLSELLSPLLLSLWLRAAEGSDALPLPASPDQLVDRYVELLLTIDRAGRTTPSPARARRYLTVIAQLLQRSSRVAFSADDRDVRQALRTEGLKGVQVDRFLEGMTKAGLLKEVPEENTYLFRHITFLEHFARQADLP